MRRFILCIVVCCSIAVLAQAQAQAQTPSRPSSSGPNAAPKPAPATATSRAPYHPAPSANPDGKPKQLKVSAPVGAKVVVIPIDETVELGLSAFVRRALADNDDAAVIILDVNTFGGRVDAAVQIRDALLEAKPKTVAFVHPRAISAGALISLACDNVIMSHGATLGAATPVQAGGGGGKTEAVDEKTTSYMRAEMRSTAEANNRRGDVAEAMVDRDVEIAGITDSGKLLTLDTDGALNTGIADSIAIDLEDVYKQLGLDAPTIVKVQINWGERIARVLTSPMVSGLLLSVGMLGLMIAFYTRTVGPFTIAGFACLALFFGGHATVHLVGWEEMLLLIAGLVLLLLEVFVIPGFGLAGVSGLALVISSMVLALFSTPIDVSFEIGILGDAMTRVLISLVGGMAAAALLVPLIPKTPFGRKLVLQTDQTGYVGTEQPSHALVGAIATALTDLKPSGRVEINGTRYEATSERAFIERGLRARVISVRGGELIVRIEEA